MIQAWVRYIGKLIQARRIRLLCIHCKETWKGGHKCPDPKP